MQRNFQISFLFLKSRIFLPNKIVFFFQNHSFQAMFVLYIYYSMSAKNFIFFSHQSSRQNFFWFYTFQKLLQKNWLYVLCEFYTGVALLLYKVYFTCLTPNRLPRNSDLHPDIHALKFKYDLKTDAKTGEYYKKKNGLFV